MLGSWAGHSWDWAAGPMGLRRGMSDRTIPPGMKKTAMMIAVDGINGTDQADGPDGGNRRIAKWRLG